MELMYCILSGQVLFMNRIILVFQDVFEIRMERGWDWSLIKGRGGYKTGERRHVKFYPYEKVAGREKF